MATRFGREMLGEPGGSEGLDHAMAERHGPGIGAEIMGANKFGPPGWQDDPEWRGWWGDDTPFHTPTYVLTHRPLPPMEMEGGTTFHFLDATSSNESHAIASASNPKPCPADTSSPSADPANSPTSSAADRGHRGPVATLTASTRNHMEHYADVDAYLAASEQWPDEIAVLRPILLATELEEKIKWGKPCYCIEDDANVVLIQEFADHLALMFLQGVLLDDPDGLLHDQGPNTHGPRRMKFSSTDDVENDSTAITEFVRQAIGHTRAGTELPERPDEHLAPELVERLASDPDLAEAFNGLTPGRQREYNLHISAAKRSETRERRIDTVTLRILGGLGLRDR